MLIEVCPLGLPHYRYLSPAPVAKQGIPRPKSDPNMGKVKSQGRQQRLGYHLDEPGVHGGEYSVRPNMEESMTFLKKLFTHQQEGGAGFPNLMSPPDSPLCTLNVLELVACHLPNLNANLLMTCRSVE